MSEPAPAKSAAPRHLGRYEVIAELASGGMGTVYLARHAGEGGFQRLFAIKLMHAHLAEDRVFVDMLRDEARLAARLHHPNVVPIVDLGSQDGRYYVVMEYIDGCSLIALAARHKTDRPPELVVPIMIDTLEGLHAAHTLCDDENNAINLVHRDVSPQNILIGTDGIGRITDFGIAKAETRITSTRPGTRKGKLSYMAPEQIKEDGENIDLRADIFAAGAVLWSALTGQPLFRGASDGATLNNILNKPVLAPSKVGLKPPTAFDAVCLRALQRDPRKRFDSALEMAEALRAALDAIGMKTTRASVARWVVSSFATELDERRRSIRAAAQAPRPTTDASLPAIPALMGPASLSSPNLGSAPPPPILTPAPPPPPQTSARSSTPPSLSTINAFQSVFPGTPHAATRSKKAIFIVIAAAALAMLVIFVWGATRSNPTTTISVSSDPAAPPAPIASAAPESAASPEPSSDDLAPTAASALPLVKASSETRKTARVAEAPRPSGTGKKPAESSKPAPEPPPTKPTAAPAPAGTAGVKIEKNPYLRHE